MREAKWWLRGQKLVQRSRSNRLIPRADSANAPPFLPLDPVVESKAVHNMGGYQIDEGRDDWFLGQDDYLNENAAPPPDGVNGDGWNWDDPAGYIDDTLAIEVTAQTSHLDPGDLADVWEEQPAVEAGYDDPTTDLVEASTGPVQPNAPNPEGGYSDEWDFFDEPIPLHVVPGDYLQSDVPIITDQVDDLPPADEIDPDDWWHALDAQQDPNELAEGDDWHDWHESAVDSIHDILDEDDDAVGPDQPPMPVDDGWPWQIQDDVGESFDLQEPAGITLPALPYSDDFPLDDAVDDHLPADEPPQADDQLPADAWPWQDDVDDTPIDDQAPQSPPPVLDMPPDDPWPWDEAPAQYVVPSGYTQIDYVPPPEQQGIDDGWLWEAELPPDVVPTGYTQADLPPPPLEQRNDSTDWDWSEEVPHLVMPGGYTQVDGAPPPIPTDPQLPYSEWHWEADTVEDEWREFIERIGYDGATGSDASVSGNPTLQNLLRRRDDFETMSPADDPWNWHPIDPDDAWWPEPLAFVLADVFASVALAYPDQWEWDGETTEPWLVDLELGADKPIDPNVAGIAALQNLLRRRDDFDTQPVQHDDFDWYQLDHQDELPLDSGPVVDAQVLFLEVPVEDAADHFPPQPDTDWPEPSDPVGPNAAADLPRFDGDHQWAQWEDGEGDYEIEPSQPVDAPAPPAPDEWSFDEDGIQDDWWHEGAAEFKPADFFALPGPDPTSDAWDFTADATDDTWWQLLPQPDTDGTAGPDLCPMLLAEAYARIAELEALLAECRAHGHGDGGGGGASGDGDDIDHGHHHGHHRDHDGEQRHLLEMQERDEREHRERAAQEKRARIERDNAFILGLAAATVRRRKRKKEDPK